MRLWPLVLVMNARGTSARQDGELLALLPPPESAADEKPMAQWLELPLSVGLRTLDGVFCPLLPRGAPLPAKAVKLFTTTEDDQATARLEVLAGERALCHGNMRLGAIMLTALPVPSHRSFVQLEVVLEVDTDGHVELTATEVESRALGEDFAHAKWHGHILEAAAALGDVHGSEVVPFSYSLARHLPVLLASRTIRVGSRDIVIRQRQRSSEEHVGTGGVLWEAAIVLADYVGRGHAVWRGRRVLELGTGTGLVAIALALEGAQVLATDGNPQVIEGTKHNVVAAGVFPAPGGVDVDIFDWNSAEDLRRMQEAGPWDAVIGSDLVYPGNSSRKCVSTNDYLQLADVALLKALDALVGPFTKVVIALKDRTGEVGRFTQAAMVEGWFVNAVPSQELAPHVSTMLKLSVLNLSKQAKP
mmetsp:Transcript_41383/g.95906  ORF Transcript_41383/g.95906 Transcript_41383/m.95906 type:complete len:417 (-) Transcript_41383:47-1297(-)